MAEYRYVLRGEVDLATVQRVRADLRRAVNRNGVHVLVDCTHLTFIDSTGVAALLEANQMLEEQGRYMLIANVPREFRRTFDALGAADLLSYDRTSLEPA
jgi:anti-sigma B factor antagonist